MKINWHVLKIAKAHFKYTIWFMISEKTVVSYLYVSSPWWCTHVPNVSVNKDCMKSVQIRSYFWSVFSCI